MLFAVSGTPSYLACASLSFGLSVGSNGECLAKCATYSIPFPLQHHAQNVYDYLFLSAHREDRTKFHTLIPSGTRRAIALLSMCIILPTWCHIALFNFAFRSVFLDTSTRASFNFASCSHSFGILFLHRFQSCFHTRNGLIYAKIMHSHFLFNVMDGFIYSSYLYVPRWDLPRKAAWQGIILGKRRRRGERNGCTTEVMNKGRVI